MHVPVQVVRDLVAGITHQPPLTVELDDGELERLKTELGKHEAKVKGRKGRGKGRRGK